MGPNGSRAQLSQWAQTGPRPNWANGSNGLESPAQRFVGRSRGLHGKFMELEPYRIPIGARPNIIKHFIFWVSFQEI